MMDNIIFQHHKINACHRITLTKQKPFCLWFTGLSGSGKSTLSTLVEEKLYHNNNLTYLLDGDNIRHGLCNDLSFNNQSRVENIRRIGELNKLFLDSGIIVLNSFISPFKKDREQVRNLIGYKKFIP